MTVDKAKDLFSAYLEDALEPALRIAFEQKLATDPGLRTEYQQFAATYDTLSELTNYEVDVPDDLHERIMAKIDRHVWDQKQTVKASWFGRFRPLSIAGIAFVAVIGGVFSLVERHGNASPASLGLSGQAMGDHLEVIAKKDKIFVEFAPTASTSVEFRSEPSNAAFLKLTSDRSHALNRELDNPNSEPSITMISTTGPSTSETIYVVLPGSSTQRIRKGSGTVLEFSKALAGFYRVPVTISPTEFDAQVQWNFDQPDARVAAETALKKDYAVDQRDGNLVHIAKS